MKQKAIQELNSKIGNSDTRITTLERENSAVKNQNEVFISAVCAHFPREEICLD